MCFLILNPVTPVTAAGRIDKNNRPRVCFTGLDKCESFITFVVRSEPPRKQHRGVGFLDKNKLASEKVFKRHKLVIVKNDRIRLLFKRQAYVHTETVFAAGTL